MTQPYDELKKNMKNVRLLSASQSILAWDMRTYMPSEGIEQRGEILAILGRITHEKMTNPKIGNLISQCSGLENIQQRISYGFSIIFSFITAQSIQFNIGIYV